MNGLSVSGEKADQNLQIKMSQRLQRFLSLSVRHDQTFP